MLANLSFLTLINYLENLAVLHVDVASSFRWNKVEFHNALRPGVTLPVMLIDSPETTAEGDNSKTFHNHSLAITILGKEGVNTAPIDNTAEQNEVLDYTQRIAFEVASRIVEDSRTIGHWLYGMVDKASFHYFKVGPAFADGLYGYRLEFNVSSKECYKIDTAKWSDLIEN